MNTGEKRQLASNESTAPSLRTATVREDCRRFRLLATMVEGLAGGLPEAWRSYGNVELARLAARQMMQDRRVLQVAIVEDGPPLQFIEWVGRSCRPKVRR